VQVVEGPGRVTQRVVTDAELQQLLRSGRRVAPIPARDHLEGYVQLRRHFPANTPIFAVAAMDEHVIGFDMFTPPYDTDLRRFREEKVWPVRAADVSAALVREIHAKARERGFDYVLVAPYQASQARFQRGGRVRHLDRFLREGPLPAARVYALTCRDPRMQQYMRLVGFTPDQIGRLIRQNVSPEPDEQEALERVGELLDRIAAETSKETDSMAKVLRLRQLMRADTEHFAPVIDSPAQPEGIGLFEVK
jgi:hypothetical protein